MYDWLAMFATYNPIVKVLLAVYIEVSKTAPLLGFCQTRLQLPDHMTTFSHEARLHRETYS